MITLKEMIQELSKKLNETKIELDKLNERTTMLQHDVHNLDEAIKLLTYVEERNAQLDSSGYRSIV